MEVSDEILLKRILNKDYDAFNLLYARYHKLFMHWVCRRTNSYTADDITQLFWREIWSNPALFNVDKTGSAKHSFLKILSFRIINYFKSVEGREESNFGEEALEQLEGSYAYTHVAEDLEYKEIQQMISDVLRTLPQLSQDIFELRYNKQLSTGKVAKLLHISEKTVQKRYNGIQKDLKETIINFYLRNEDALPKSAFLILLMLSD